MKNDIKNRLHELSYTVETEDNFLIDHLIEKNIAYITGNIGNENMPADLQPMFNDRVCGQFLKEKSLQGKLKNFSEEDAITKISQGDLSVTFKSRKNKLDQLFDYLINDNFDFSPYRSVVW